MSRPIGFRRAHEGVTDIEYLGYREYINSFKDARDKDVYRQGRQVQSRGSVMPTLGRRHAVGAEEYARVFDPPVNQDCKVELVLEGIWAHNSWLAGFGSTAMQVSYSPELSFWEHEAVHHPIWGSEERVKTRLRLKLPNKLSPVYGRIRNLPPMCCLG